jgi:hypothetical protein
VNCARSPPERRVALVKTRSQNTRPKIQEARPIHPREENTTEGLAEDRRQVVASQDTEEDESDSRWCSGRHSTGTCRCSGIGAARTVYIRVRQRTAHLTRLASARL